MHNLYKFYKKYVQNFKLLSLLFVVSSTFVTGLVLVQPIIIGKTIDIITNNNLINRMHYVYKYIILILILFIASTLISFLLNILSEYLRHRMSYLLIKDMIKHLQECSILNIINKDVAYIIDVLNNDCYTIVNFLLQHITNLFVNLFAFIVSLYVLFSINFKMSLIILITMPIYIMVYFIFKNKLFDSGLKLKENQSNFVAILYRQLQDIKFLRLNHIFDYLNDIMNSHFKKFILSAIEYTKKSYLFSSTSDIVSTCGSILLLILGANEIISGNLSIGMFTIINTYISKLVGNITYFIGFSSNYQQLLVSFFRISKIQSLKQDTIGNILIQDINTINLRDISFSFDTNELVLNNLSLNFEKGNIYAIKGYNGSGKSTLINLMLGLFSNYSGEIKYNSIDINLINMNYLLKNLISIVDQEPVILADTFINNITLGNKEYNLGELENYIHNFKLDSIYHELKDNIIDSNTISGGQKQKVSLIRALLKKSSVLILDEPTSALDKESTLYLKTILEKLKNEKIIIIITHDLIFNDVADSIINLESSRYIENI